MARVREPQTARFSAYTESLPAQQRGQLILILFANAVLTLALEGVRILLITRAIRQARLSPRPAQTLRSVALAPTSIGVTWAFALHRLTRQHFMRKLDQRLSAALPPASSEGTNTTSAAAG